MPIGADCHDRAGGLAHDSFHDAVQQHMHETEAAMRAQNDEIDGMILRIANDLYKRNTLDSFGLVT